MRKMIEKIKNSKLIQKYAESKVFASIDNQTSFR